MDLKIKPERKHFLIAFCLVVLTLSAVKKLHPEIASALLLAEAAPPEAMETPVPLDSIGRQSRLVDSLLLRPRAEIVLVNGRGKPVKNRVTSVRSFQEAFPDLNDVQLATARKIGIPHIADREEAMRRKKDLVYVGDSPFYEVKNLTHSIPYLVPRAATLLGEISRSFLDSLATKGYPFHKLVVTSVLRTQHDVSRLRRVNVNASENSCHQYGTTFDISYNQFVRVQDPEGAEQPQTWGVTLKSILAEVLEDQRLLGTCYVKYEQKQACFHITAR